ncbi:hypothetical protein E3J84_00085 [Candidatus Aerophobetes bacterium]|uniref:Uncharacterized protein n=1 Tax=Aerophobetes bacterium TaxID=2030807 RepID=A0A523S6F3_UNCAE|nr:MAG: hypothetical protein E3J84_00085 [Candidatus Aerophobetes bacterium]
MTEKKRVVFMSKLKNLNIFLAKGGTITIPVPGGVKSRVEAAKMAKFRNFGYVTSNPEELKLLYKYIEEHPEDDIHEVIPPTPGEILAKKEAKLAEMMEEVAKAREEAGEASLADKVPEDMDRVSEETPEREKPVKVYTEKCPDCDWVAESFVSEAQMKNKLRGHRAGKHKK